MTSFRDSALAIDFSHFEDAPISTPRSAVVRGRDGKLRAIDIARVAWTEDCKDANVIHLAALNGSDLKGNC